MCFAALFAAIDDQRSAASSASHSQQVLAQAYRLERLVLDLETGQRGYALTHETRFLEPWRAALYAAPEASDRLSALVRDNPAQLRRANAIASAIAAYETFTRQLVDDPPHGAAVTARTESGKRMVDALRARFGAFVSAEQKLSESRRRDAASTARDSVVIAGGGLLASLLLLACFVVYLVRVVVAPVRRLAQAAVGIARGDLESRVPERGVGEVRELAGAFNRMTSALQQGRDELESQNAELELQTAELEDQQLQLGEANEELVAQHSELERALSELESERRLVGSFYEFAQRVAGVLDEHRLAQTILDGAAEFLAAPIGLLYLGQGDEHVLAATRALERDAVAGSIRRGAGFAGRAIDVRRAVTASAPHTTLALPSVAGSLTATHELYVPLVYGERALGVLIVARVEDLPFTADVTAAAEHLAAQAAGAVANLHSFLEEQRTAQVNAAVLEATQDGIALLNPAGTVILANSAFDAITAAHGVQRGVGLERGTTKVSDDVDDREAYVAWWSEIASNPSFTGSFEYRLTSSGRSFVIYSAPVVAGGGEAAGRLIVMRETTAERDADRIKSDLVNTVSHELRTPLASILGFAELLVVRDPDAETRRKYVQTIYSEGQRLTALVNDFLDLQRIEQGRLELAPAPLDIAALIEEEIELYRVQSDRHTFDLAVERPVTALADRARLAQVLGNLLSNAVKYSPEGGTVSIGASRHNGSVRVTVTDRGVGIPSHDRPQIFQKFFRGSSGTGIGGTGLGLAVCKEIVLAHGGEIGFDSVEGNGSTFWFEVPAA